MTKTLQDLIDEIVGEMSMRIPQLNYRDNKQHLDFFCQSLIKIAKATAEAGRVEEKNDIAQLIADTEGSFNPTEMDEGLKRGFNQAVQEQQQKLKKFLGEYYD